MDVREKLVELFYDNNVRCDQKIEGLADDVMGIIANGVTVQNWISVDDRLPDPFESVLVLRDGKISIDYNEGNGWFAYDFNGKRVTHWMQLPDPPKGE